MSISAVERLQRLQIYPIVLLLRFKSAKQIREIRDYGTDKISAKAAKEMYERALKLESDYKQYISGKLNKKRKKQNTHLVPEFGGEGKWKTVFVISISNLYLFLAVIPGVSIKHMCTQIKDAVDKEQDKLLWVPASNAA